MSNWSEGIFKSYDIRGIYPTELNEEVASLIGQVIAGFSSGGKIVIGRDMRLSSPALHQALLKGLMAGGAKVDDIGEVPIDAVYFAVGKFNYDAGVMITASHNPTEYNGFKIIKKGMEWVRGGELKDLIGKLDSSARKSQGEVKELDIWEDYIKHLLSFVNHEKLKDLKVVVDAGNGMAGKTIPKLFASLPFKLTPLFFDLDGSFPNRPSNPLAPNASKVVSEKIIEVGADLGIMFDGDTDRVFFLDETGKFVSADTTLLVLAKEFLSREPGATIAYNLICSRAVPEFITKWGGKPLRTAVGFVNVMTALKANDGIMGGELSAHYSFRDNFYSDSGFIAALLVLEYLSITGKKLSQLVADYSPYVKLPEINLTVNDKQAAIDKVKNYFKDAKIDELDGVTVEYEDWWVNVRPSNTEPLLRVTLEANNEKILEEKKQEVLSLLK